MSLRCQFASPEKITEPRMLYPWRCTPFRVIRISGVVYIVLYGFRKVAAARAKRHRVVRVVMMGGAGLIHQPRTIEVIAELKLRDEVVRAVVNEVGKDEADDAPVSVDGRKVVIAVRVPQHRGRVSRVFINILQQTERGRRV